MQAQCVDMHDGVLCVESSRSSEFRSKRGIRSDGCNMRRARLELWNAGGVFECERADRAWSAHAENLRFNSFSGDEGNRNMDRAHAISRDAVLAGKPSPANATGIARTRHFRDATARGRAHACLTGGVA